MAVKNMDSELVMSKQEQFTVSDLQKIGRKLCEQNAEFASSLLDKPFLTDFEEVADVVVFLEEAEGMVHSPFILWPKIEQKEFIYQALAVLLALYDPSYLKGVGKNTINGFRAKMVDFFCFKSPSSVSDRFKKIKGWMEVYPFYSQRVYDLANQYKEQKQKTNEAR